jgi:hypothetical protein
LLPEKESLTGLPQDEFDVDGMPIPVGGVIRAAYVARSPLGMVDHSWFVYRVNDGPWERLRMSNVTPKEADGEFNLKRGVFAKTPFEVEVEYHLVPSRDEIEFPSGLEAGGRKHFEIGGLRRLDLNVEAASLSLTGSMMIPAFRSGTKLKEGDRVEFYIEVADRNPALGRDRGRSEIRIKEVVSGEEYFARMATLEQSETKLRQLEERQRSIFTPKK